MGAMTTYHITIRDHETQTVLGYYNGSWTTDRCRAGALRSVMRRKPHARSMSAQR